MWVFFINFAKILEDSKFHDIILGKWSEHMKKNKTNISKLLLSSVNFFNTVEFN